MRTEGVECDLWVGDTVSISFRRQALKGRQPAMGLTPLSPQSTGRCGHVARDRHRRSSRFRAVQERWRGCQSRDDGDGPDSLRKGMSLSPPSRPSGCPPPLDKLTDAPVSFVLPLDDPSKIRLLHLGLARLNSIPLETGRPPPHLFAPNRVEPPDAHGRDVRDPM